MRVLPASLNPEQTYRLMTGVVVPRPIAWITSLSADGVVNLAPFSCFTFVSNKPPMVGVNVGRKAGRRKDTGRNIKALREYVVNIPDETMIEAVHRSAVEYPAEVSEVAELGLDVLPGERVRVPRLRGTPISLECRLHQTIPFGQTGSEFVVGEILAFHIRDGLFTDGKVNTGELRPIARLAGPTYASLGPITRLAPVAQTPKSVQHADPPG